MNTVESTQNVLRFFVEISIQKGLFTWEEYGRHLEQLKNGR